LILSTTTGRQVSRWRFLWEKKNEVAYPANDNQPRPATVFLLMAQYHGKAVISVDEICRDYFPHLDSAKFIRKVGAGHSDDQNGSQSGDRRFSGLHRQASGCGS